MVPGVFLPMLWLWLQVILGIVLIWPFNGWGYDLAAMPGYVFVALGFALLFWTLRNNRPHNWQAAPEVKEGANMITSGPYRWVRHPMYTASLTFLFGFVLLDRHWLDLVAWIGLVGTFLGKSRIEERSMLKRFPEYAAYRHQTGAFLPRWRQ